MRRGGFMHIVNRQSNWLNRIIREKKCRLYSDYAYPIILNTSFAFCVSQNSVIAFFSTPAQNFLYPKAAFSVSQ